MARQVLLDSDIEKGRLLVDKLKANKVPMSAAFWYLDPDQEKYSLLIATPVVDEVGPRSAYGMIEAAMSGIPPSQRVFTDAVKVVSQIDPLVAGLRKIEGIKDTWLFSTPLPNAYFNEGYIYFIVDAVPMKRGA